MEGDLSEIFMSPFEIKISFLNYDYFNNYYHDS